ncbi:hypothetical protein [Synechococcus phage Ssp-JY42]|nr:hypothetical protein [Synechococcus phage Yong-M4-211]
MSREWQDDWPTQTVLWDKRHKARRPHLCDMCNEEIAVGSMYRSVGVIVDGEFSTFKNHGFGGYPPNCPRFAELHAKELADQFEADRALFPTSEAPWSPTPADPARKLEE